MPRDRFKESLRDRLRRKIRPNSSRFPQDAKSDTKARWINENLSQDRKLSSLLIQAEADVICGQGVPWDWRDQESCLSPSLDRVMRDQTALTYFIQFLEPLNALCYVHFWLSADNFRTAVRESIAKDSGNPSPVDCCPDVKQTLSQMLLEELGDCVEHNGSGDVKVTPKKKVRVAASIDDCNRSCGVVPQWSESAPMTPNQHVLRDAVKICDRYLKSTSTWPRPLPRGMVESIVQNIRANSDGDVFDPDIFLPAQNLVFEILRDDYFVGFLASDAFCNYRIDVLTNKSLNLKDAMYDDAAAFFFMETKLLVVVLQFLEKEHHLDLIEFLMTAGNITSQLHNHDLPAVDAQNDAMVVYDRYVSLQATRALGFSDSIRLEVETMLCREDRVGPDPDTFVKPATVVNTLLEKHFFPEFLKSHLYYTYTQELVTTFQLDHLNARRRALSAKSEASKASEDATSVSSSHTTATGSQVGNPGMASTASDVLPLTSNKASSIGLGRKMSTSASAPVDVRKAQSVTVDPLLVPPCQPDHWTMGQIDNLGRFYSFRDLDGHPSSYDAVVSPRESGPLSKVFNSFMGRNTKEEEAAAWQMAEMMIRDVTSVTMGVSRMGMDDETASCMSGHS